MSDYKVKINGQVADLNEETIIASDFQSVDIGDLSELKSDVTSTIKLPLSDTNNAIFKLANKLGSQSQTSLGSINASLESRGVPILNNGRAVLKDISNGYNINILGSNYSFFEKIKGKTLRDLDLTSYDFTPSLTYFQNNRQNTTGICFPIVNYGVKKIGAPSALLSEFASQYEFEYQYILPWMHLSTFVYEIITQAGFTYTGNLFNKSSYRRTIISLIPPVNTEPLDGSDDVIMRDWVPDMSQADLIKSVLFMHGAFASTIGQTIYFIQFKELYENQSYARDWSEKYDSVINPTIKFNIGYAINNLFKYETLDAPSDEGYRQVISPAAGYREDITEDEMDYTIVSDNKNLAEEKTIVTLPFRPVTNQAVDIYLYDYSTTNFSLVASKVFFPLIESAEENEDGDDYVFQPFDVRVMMRATYRRWNDGKTQVIAWGYGSDKFNVPPSFYDNYIYTGYTIPWFTGPKDIEDSNTAIDLSWEHLISESYYQFENSLLKDPKMVIGEFYLDPIDVYYLKEIMNNGKHGNAVPVYIKQLNGHYYVNKVSRYIPGTKCKVELIKL